MTAMEEQLVRHLSFEDVSLTLPGTMLESLQAEQLSAADVKRILSELSERSVAFRRLEQDALERATGCSPAELSYVKDDIDRLKGTAAELCAEAAFMESIKENRPLPTSNYVDDLKKNADGKKFRDLVENVKRELDETAQTFVRTLEEFDAGVSAAQAGLGEVEEANTLVAQLAAELASGEALQRELEAERRALEAAEASNRELQGKIAARQREVGALAHEIAPAERHVAELTEEAQALEAKQAGEKKNKDAQKDIEQAGLYNSEVCAMLRGLSGIELLRATPEALLFRVSGPGGEHEVDLACEGSTVTGVAFQSAEPRLAALDVTGLEGMHLSAALCEVRTRISQEAAGWAENMA